RPNLVLEAKEALNNILPHAAANEVRITTVLYKDVATLTIEDNGKGFEHAAENGTSDGLRNMQTRMSEAGGTYSIQSKPGKGTRIDFTFPCHSENESNRINF